MEILFTLIGLEETIALCNHYDQITVTISFIATVAVLVVGIVILTVIVSVIVTDVIRKQGRIQ